MNTYRHGDLLLVEVDAVPRDARSTTNRVLAEGEVTGHHHRLEGAVQVLERGDELYFVAGTGTHVTHEEHARIDIAPGRYKVVRQREYDPFEDAVRQVQD